jgi:ferritin-like metal-binding protein YciE
MAEKTLTNLFEDTLKDIFYAERKILAALPKMMKAAQSDELKAAFEKHRGETEGQIQRLEEVFDLIGQKPKGKTCPAIDGILEEGKEVIEEYAGTEAIDVGLIASAQAVEHYEMARYGSLKRLAEMLGMTEAEALFDETLQEEIATDEALEELAESSSPSMEQQAAE